MTTTKNGKRIGRPPGSKNAATILREEGAKKITKAAQDTLTASLPRVIKALITRAETGDINAIKEVLRHALPADPKTGQQSPNIVINVGEISNAEATERQQSVTVRQVGTPPRTIEGETVPEKLNGREIGQAEPQITG